MKHTKTIVICAAFLLVAVGGLMIAAAAIKGNFDIENMKGLSHEMKTFEVTLKIFIKPLDSHAAS